MARSAEEQDRINSVILNRVRSGKEKARKKSGKRNLAGDHLLAKLAKKGRKRDGPERRAEKLAIAAKWMELVRARNHLKKDPAEVVIKTLLTRQGATCHMLGYKSEESVSFNAIRNVWKKKKMRQPPSSALADFLATSIARHDQGDHDHFSLSPARPPMAVPDIGGEKERNSTAKQGKLCTSVFRLRQRPPSFNFNTVSHLAVQVLKSHHDGQPVEDVLEQELRTREASPLLKGLLLLPERFDITDLAAAVLKRIEEVKKKLGLEDTDQPGTSAELPPVELN